MTMPLYGHAMTGYDDGRRGEASTPRTTYTGAAPVAHPPLGHRSAVEVNATTGQQLDARAAKGLVRAALTRLPGPDQPDARLAYRAAVHHTAVRDAVTDLDPAARGCGLPPEIILRRLFGVS